MIQECRRGMRLALMLAACASTAVAAAAGAAAETGTLSVHVAGFAHARGHARAKLLRSGDTVMRPDGWTAEAPIRDGEAVLQWSGLAPGWYAVIVFHDENDNRLLDHGLLRLPAEPLGFSNGFELSIGSGMPSFEKLKFEFHAPAQAIELKVR